MTDRELMQQALYYLDDNCGKYTDDYRKLIEALRARLAQPEIMYRVNPSVTDEQLREGIFNAVFDEYAKQQKSNAKKLREAGYTKRERVNVLMEQVRDEEPEPVATLWQHGETGRTRVVMNGDITDCGANWIRVSDLYTAPPQREWQGLTDDELRSMCKQTWVFDTVKQWAEIIEAKLKEKNT